MKHIGRPYVPWVLVLIMGVILPAVKYFGRRRVERDADVRSLEIQAKQVQLARDRLQLAEEFGSEAATEAIRAIHENPNDVIAQLSRQIDASMSPEQRKLAEDLYNQYVQLLFMLCIHAGSESDLVDDVEVLWFPLMKTYAGVDLQDLLQADSKLWSSRRELARSAFWSAYDALNSIEFDFGHWADQVDAFARSIPRSRLVP